MMRFLSDLVAIDSSKNENLSACAAIVKREAEKNGFSVQTFDAEKLSRDRVSRQNLVITFNAGKKDTLLLLTHYDVVPAGEGWNENPFKATEVGDRVYGRGTADDKGAVAACLEAMKQLKASRKSRVNVKLLVVCDEEMGGKLGIEFLLKEAKELNGSAQLVVDGDVFPQVGASGIVFGKIRIEGKQGHAGWAHKAENAINFPFLLEISKYAEERKKKKSKLDAPPFSGVGKVYGRFNITMVHAGEKENVIPGECEAKFDLRLNPEEDEQQALEEFKQYFEKAKKKHKVNATLECTMVQPGYYTEKDDKFVEQFMKITQTLQAYAGLGGNDGRHLKIKGIPTICFGPIRRDDKIDNNIHGKNEFVLVKDLEWTRDVIIKLCEEWKE
ncbi:M20/M25/M40 family metallo-hydrolase [Candidatus Micrarchaeota archaeon]|nr:M20/M25/M40 family metallo-hydrolase [Candidatus Micrarchaeota archaeon]